MFEIYYFLALTLILVFGNILIRIFSTEDVQLGFNAVVLLLLVFVSYLLYNSIDVYFNIISVNYFSVFFFFIFSLGVLLLNFLAYARSDDYGNFALMAAFSLVGMYIVSSASTLIAIFVGLELVAVPSSFIILLSRKNSLESAAKYFIMASIAMALLSLALVLVYASSNTLGTQLEQRNGLIDLALVIFIASLGFESSVFPFNLLLPDVYQGAGSYATAMLGGVNKKVGFVALMQVVLLLFINVRIAFTMIAALSVATMFYGNLVALMQNNLKRLLAYSSISQAGYILIGLAAGSRAGAAASFFQIFAHMFLFIGAMAIISWLESKNRNEINDVIGLYKENRFSAIALTIFLLSFVGLPFTTGFVGKFLLFLSAVNSNLIWLAFFGVVNSIISIFYYAKVITAMYTDKLGARYTHLDSPTRIVVIVSLLITVLYGVYPDIMINLANYASVYLAWSV